MPNSDQINSYDCQSPSVIRNPDAAAMFAAAQAIVTGELVAFPTETVYGLGADASNSMAVARIFNAKGRPRFNPLIVHVADLDHARRYGHFTAAAEAIASKFWPGPMTIVTLRIAAPVGEGDVAVDPISDLVTAGLPTIALRVPQHPIAQALIRTSGRPLAAPSANRSGHVSATHADHVARDLDGRVSMILDGGPTRHGIESTIIDASGETLRLLRPGAISRDAIEAVLGCTIKWGDVAGSRPSAPGQLESHYATRAAIRMDAAVIRPDEAVLAFGHVDPVAGQPFYNLSPSGNLIEAAANLFAALRFLDQPSCNTIAVMTIPNHGLGEAINDRLRRASAPRTQ